MSMAMMPTFLGGASIASRVGERETGRRRAGVVGRTSGEIYVYIYIHRKEDEKQVAMRTDRVISPKLAKKN